MTKYIHGYTGKEQDRLFRQSAFLESYIYNKIDFSNCNHIIEIGCGVGAQIQILLNHFPHLKITGVDISEAQISRAGEFLKPHIEAGRVSLHITHGEVLPFPDQSFDGALICFVLEHINNPLYLLKEVKRIMQSGTNLYCTEAFNTGLYIHPTCLAFQTYWEIFNRYQEQLNGDPNVGVKLSNLALQSGFSETTLDYIPLYLDGRTKNMSQRTDFIDFITEVLLSAAPALIALERITPSLPDAMILELQEIKNNQDSIFVWPLEQLKAVKCAEFSCSA
ncbi:class I SAM-dependent methyltransferase [Nostoc muscorum FACHB-395]|uniref:class I SAM-dependent methyltransferase n=1 Tax=Nostoc sp. TaxID=1180 RepID=UPI001688A200|nr:class I SAM-dependent methyltransferase [Desmonostoc muscorum FACHB-395]